MHAQVSGNVALAASSTNIAFRVYAYLTRSSCHAHTSIYSIVLWKHHKWVSQLLAVICVVDISLSVLCECLASQLYLIYAGIRMSNMMAVGAFSVDSLWDDEHQFCVISAGRTQRGLLSLYCFSLFSPSKLT